MFQNSLTNSRIFCLPTKMSFLKSPEGFEITAFNPTGQHLEGSFLLATPYETWGDIHGNVSASGTISPYSFSVKLAPNEKKVYEFTADISDEEFFTAYYAAAKLCCNGRIHFTFADRHGFRHNKWSTDIPRINGSIDDFLHM